MKRIFLYIVLAMLVIVGVQLVYKGPSVDANAVQPSEPIVAREVPSWFENTLYMIGALAGLNSFGRYFLLWSGVLLQGLSAIFWIVFVWCFTVVSRPTVKEAYQFGFYIACLLAGLTGLGEAYMLLTVPFGWTLFIVELIVTVFIAFIALGGAFSYIGAKQTKTVTFAPDGTKSTTESYEGTKVHVLGRNRQLKNNEGDWR